MRISDWSSDVCSSDLIARLRGARDEIFFLDEIVGRQRCQLLHGSGPRLTPYSALNRTGDRGHEHCAGGGTGRCESGRRLRRSASTKAKYHPAQRSEEHTSELQSLMRISYAVFCLKKKSNISY